MKQVNVVLGMAILMLAMGMSSAYASKKDENRIKTMLEKQMPDGKVTNVTETPVPGLYEVIMPPKILYVSTDGKYIISGDIIKVSTGENITLPQRDSVRSQAIEMLGEESMIVFAPKKVKHTVTVFTDIDCGYCRKLHNEVDKYTALGIKVRYTAYPRAGIGSESYKKAVSVWCAKDRNAAMTDAKNGKKLAEKNCKNPVADHYRMGEKIGIRGTPALVLESGQIVPGYVPADRLFDGLEQQKKTK